VRVIKALCLVSKEWHAASVPLLYTKIRLRRIPQLSCLVSTLEYRLSNKPVWTGRSYGSYTTHLDLSFYIPPEWNNLYADDVRRLIACVPNLQSYRSRPMLPILAPRPVPTPIIVCLADTRNELLSELELSEQEGPQMPDLIRLLQACTYLEKLTLGKYVFDGGLHSSTAVLRLPSLKSLEVKVTSRLTPGSFASLPSPHLLAEASKWDLPHLESLTLILYDDNRIPSAALNAFLNIHGHKLRQMTIRNADPIMQGPKLQISGILSRCPDLEEVAVVASSTAPLILARAHLHLQRVRFLGTAPGSRRDGSGGGDLGHLLALAVDNSDGRRKFPSLREVAIQGEEDETDSVQLMRMWQDAVGPNIRVLTVEYDGTEKAPDPRLVAATLGMGGVPLPRSLWSGPVDDDDEEDDEWLPDEEQEDSDEEEERYFLATMEDDGDGSDEETVRDSRSGRGRDDDQIDHTAALLIFQDSISRRIKRRHSGLKESSRDLASGATTGVTSPIGGIGGGTGGITPISGVGHPTHAGRSLSMSVGSLSHFHHPPPLPLPPGLSASTPLGGMGTGGAATPVSRDHSHHHTTNGITNGATREHKDESRPSREHKDEIRPSREHKEGRPSREHKEEGRPSREHKEESKPSREHRDEIRPSAMSPTGAPIPGGSMSVQTSRRTLHVGSGAGRIGSVDLKRTSLGPGGSRPW
jgi:hypothetical protein